MHGHALEDVVIACMVMGILGYGTSGLWIPDNQIGVRTNS